MANTPTLWNAAGPIDGGPAGFATRVESCVNSLDQRTGLLDSSGVPTIPAPIPVYTLATLPTAATYPGRIIIVLDASTPNTACISNGTNWKVVTLGATVS